MRRLVVILAAVLAVLAAVFVGMVVGAHNARGSSVTCPSTVPVQRCIMVLPGHTGQQVTDQRDCFHTTPWMITDNNGAPEVWVKCGSLYVGGKSGWLGGQICITEVLQPFCLTRQDIEWIHTQDGG